MQMSYFVVYNKAMMNNETKAAELEKKKAADDIKSEIVDVSMLISEKMIGRELKEEDHRELIDSFINDIGSSDD